MEEKDMLTNQGTADEVYADNTKNKDDTAPFINMLVFFFGVLVGILISQWVIVPYFHEKSASEWLFGGWYTSDESAEIEGMCFYENYVDVKLSGGGFIRCEYSADNENHKITIFDCNGEDITVNFSQSQRMYLTGDIDAVYDYAA